MKPSLLIALVFGALAGAGFFLGAATINGGFGPCLGCTHYPLTYHIANLPAHMLTAAHIGEVLMPQQYGIICDLSRARHWTATRFVASGLGFYGIVGACAMTTVRAVAIRLLRS